MKFYFSGIGGADEFGMLCRAGVTRMLVDPHDLRHVKAWEGDLALDCGAYRRFRTGKGMSYEDYLEVARLRPYAFVTAYETIDAPAEENYAAWRRMAACGVESMPVYQWAAPRSMLLRYLDEAPLVGVGGLVNILRAKGETDAETHRLELFRARVMDDLVAMVIRWPDRLHLFGVCWLPALELLRYMEVRADSSKWLDGRRYRLSIFENTRTHHLATAPSRSLGKGHLDGSELSIDNARNMRAYLEPGEG